MIHFVIKELPALSNCCTAIIGSEVIRKFHICIDRIWNRQRPVRNGTVFIISQNHSRTIHFSCRTYIGKPEQAIPGSIYISALRYYRNTTCIHTKIIACPVSCQSSPISIVRIRRRCLQPFRRDCCNHKGRCQKQRPQRLADRSLQLPCFSPHFDILCHLLYSFAIFFATTTKRPFFSW